MFEKPVIFGLSEYSKEIYRQSTAGFSQTPRGLCLRLEALIQLTLSNLDSKKQDQKVQGSHSQRKHRMAFTVLLRQYRLTGFSCSALFARRPRRSVCLHLDSVKSLRVKHTTICSKSTYTIRLDRILRAELHIQPLMILEQAAMMGPVLCTTHIPIRRLKPNTTTAQKIKFLLIRRLTPLAFRRSIKMILPRYE